MAIATLLTALLAVAAVKAQIPPKPEGIKVLQSQFHENVTISYKQPGICETTPGVKSYAGYVHLPPDALNEQHEHNAYPINTFFWFFESRKDPQNAPLVIWLNGGPGGSSLMGALSENGPCFVGKDSNSTYLNPWSWNNEANVLYIDQPVQVGFSYDVLTNVTSHFDFNPETEDEDWIYKPADFSGGVPATNATFLVGTTGSHSRRSTANGTHHAAVAMWHFAQTWFEEFPGYKPNNERISLFAESYGGHYGPGIMSYFLRQNERIANGTISSPGAHYLHLNTLGIVNGCIDEVLSLHANILFPYNNTYGIQAFSDEQYASFMHNFSRPGGWVDSIHECQRLASTLDPNEHGEVVNVTRFCKHVAESASVPVMTYFNQSRSGWYDITHPMSDAFVPFYLMGFLQQGWVQAALGVPVNYTAASDAVYKAFTGSADNMRSHHLTDLATILDAGVRVHMMYGDRDMACAWPGGEASSLAIPWEHQTGFAEAGYAPLVLSPVHSAGLTRQFGNLSFTRVYQAGHLVPSYQPQAAYEILMRSITGRDVATGKVAVDGYRAETGREYATSGPGDTWWMKSDVLPAAEPECYILMPGTCSDEQKGWLKDGTAIIKDWIVVGREEEHVAKSVGHEVLQYPHQYPLNEDW